MNIETIILYVVIGLVVLAALIAGIIFLIKFFKLSPEKRKEIISDFIIGLVVNAEILIGSGKGDEKLEGDVRLRGELPFYREIALTAAYTQWYGEEVGVFGSSQRERTPKSGLTASNIRLSPWSRYMPNKAARNKGVRKTLSASASPIPSALLLRTL